MKIIANDGREFKTVEACEKYEHDLEEHKVQKVKDAENVEKLKVEYAKALHDYYEKYPEDREEDYEPMDLDTIFKLIVSTF